jgi:DNA polymerase-3 subunit beta
VKATCNAGELAAALGWAARYATRKPASSTMTLAGVLIEASGGGLTCSTFDYETAARATVSAGVGEPGRVLVSASLVAELASRLPAADVELSADGAGLALACGPVAMWLPGMAAEDYPALPALPDHLGTVDAAAFATALARVTPAASRDATLPVLTTVAVTPGAGLELTATDRYRAARVVLDWQPTAAGLAWSGGYLLPPAADLADLAKTASGAVSLHGGPGAAESSTLVGVAWAGRQATVRHVDGEFTPSAKLAAFLDPPRAFTATVGRAELEEALGRAAPVANTGHKAAHLVSLTFGEVLGIGVDVRDRGRVSDHVEVDYGDAQAPELTFSFNIAYLRDALAGCGTERVAICGRDATPGTSMADKPIAERPAAVVAVGDDTYRHVVMPVRPT